MKVYVLPRTRRPALTRILLALSLCAIAEVAARAGAQTPTPTPISTIQNTNSAFGQSITFRNVAPATTLSVTVDFTDPSPGDVKVTIWPGEPDVDTGRTPAGIPSFLVWDHEALVNASGQPVTTVHAVVMLPQTVNGQQFINSIQSPDPGSDPPTFNDPPTYTYTVQVIHDVVGSDTTDIGTFDACSLIVNPSNPGHAAPPAVHLFGGSQNQALPTQIDYGQPLNLVATAIGNPSSYKIARLGIVIDGPQSFLFGSESISTLFRSRVVSEAPTSVSGVTLSATPPILSPGTYTIIAKAVDTAGFTRTISSQLTVRRLFGLFGVSNLITVVNADSTDPANCPECNSTTLTSATILYKNTTLTDSGPLRIRLVEVASTSFRDQEGPPSPVPTPHPLTDASVGSMHPLPAGSSAQVVVSGKIDAPVSFFGIAFINFHVFAVLEESIGGVWIAIDSLKIADGVQLHAPPFNGPGGGVNEPALTATGTADPYVLDHVMISGAAIIADASQKFFTAKAILKNSTSTTSATVPTKWSMAPALSGFSIDAASGLFQAGHVPTDTVVQILGTETVGGFTKTGSFSLMIQAGPAASLNISTRALVGLGDTIMDAGFIITDEAPKTVLIRGLGPSLGSKGIANALPDPVLELHRSNVVIASNDNWQSAPNAAQIAAVLPPPDPREAVILATLSPGGYTVIEAGKNSTTGIGLTEVYDLNATAPSRLANISTRGLVQTGNDVMIAGFILGEGDATRVLLRGLGPSLGKAGVQGALQDPVLELHNANGGKLAMNDDWRQTQQSEIAATTIPPSDDRESALVVTLPKGGYTAVLSGKNATSGVGLVEVYNLRP